MRSSVPPSNPSDKVRASARKVMELIRSDEEPLVRIDEAKLEEEIKTNLDKYKVQKEVGDSWTRWDFHFSDPKNPDLTAQYVLVLDALNFCFWPLPGYEYEHLAGAIKAVAERDPTLLGAENLAKIDEETLQNWVGCALLEDFEGKATNLIKNAKGSAINLVRLVCRHFPGFRDHCVFRGKQVFFLKRAQIFVGDVYGAFEGKGLGALKDMDKLTCFPDYRIPQLLHHLKIMCYSKSLDAKIQSKAEIVAGSEEEIAIRAATVVAVEWIQRILSKYGKDASVYQLDWMLWERGEAILTEIGPHHRTKTVYY